MVIRTFLRTWWIIAVNNFQNQLLTPGSSILFIIGKLFNFVFTFLVIVAIFSQIPNLNGYSYHQAVIVVLVLNFLDSLYGFLFRAIYMFRPVLLRGDFDLDLLKPLPATFRPLFSGPDFLDLPPLLIQFGCIVYFMIRYQFALSPVSTLIAIFTFVLSLLLIYSLLLIIASVCVLTTEVDNLVWIYRSFIRAGTVPTDIYRGAFRFLLDFVVPVSALITIPAQSLIGLLTPTGLAYSSLITLLFLLVSHYTWSFSLSRYTSAGG